MNWEESLPRLLDRAVSDAGDWDDVRRRAARVVRRARRRMVASVACLTAAVVVVPPALGIGNWYPRLFRTSEPQSFIVRRTTGGCRILKGRHPIVTIPCFQPVLAPTRTHPLDDFSHYGRSAPGGRRVLRIAGAASPDISAVALLTAAGRLTATTTVRDGLYARTTDLPREPIEAVVGLDASGRPVACEPASAPDCPVQRSSSSLGG